MTAGAGGPGPDALPVPGWPEVRVGPDLTVWSRPWGPWRRVETFRRSGLTLVSLTRADGRHVFREPGALWLAASGAPLAAADVPGWPDHRVQRDGTVWQLMPSGEWHRLQPMARPGGACVRLVRGDGSVSVRQVARLHASAFGPPAADQVETSGPDPLCPGPSAGGRGADPGDVPELPDGAPALDRSPCAHLGESHGGARLTEAQVTEARRLRAGGWGFGALARRYRVAPTTISAAVRGLTWKHLADPPPLPCPGAEGAAAPERPARPAGGRQIPAGKSAQAAEVSPIP